MTLSRRTTLAATAAALSVPASAAEAELWSGNYWAVKWREDKKIWLAMYRKRLGVPQPGEGARPVLFLVHGSSSGAKSSFDLTVPGHGEYSTMNVFDRHPQRYGQIVYNGGSCALEVLAHDLGHATFRNMLKTYVADHRAGVTTKADFLAAVTAAAPPGFDVNSWARGVRLRAP